MLELAFCMATEVILFTTWKNQATVKPFKNSLGYDYAMPHLSVTKSATQLRPVIPSIGPASRRFWIVSAGTG